MYTVHVRVRSRDFRRSDLSISAEPRRSTRCLTTGVLLPELTMADVKRMGKEGRKVEAAIGGNRAGWVKGEIYGKPKKKRRT